MYEKPRYRRSLLTINDSVQGELLEQKIERIVKDKEPIKDGAPIIWTPRAQGIAPQYNIRTDRFEIAIEAMDKVSKSYKAKREERAKAAEAAKGESAKQGESIQGKVNIQGDPKPDKPV